MVDGGLDVVVDQFRSALAADLQIEKIERLKETIDVTLRSIAEPVAEEERNAKK